MAALTLTTGQFDRLATIQAEARTAGKKIAYVELHPVEGLPGLQDHIVVVVSVSTSPGSATPASLLLNAAGDVLTPDSAT